MIRKALIGFVYLLITTGNIALAQDVDANQELARQLLEIGDEIYYQQKAPEVAKEQYVAAAQADPDNIRANYMAGKLITETINKQEATPYFLKVYSLNPKFRFDILYAIGRAYQYGQEFEKAIEYYNLYTQKLEQESDYRGDDKIPLSQVQRRMYESENGIEYMQNARNFSIVNIGEVINSNSLDYAPVVNADETMMIFTSRRRDGNLNENVYDDNFPYEDIFISYKKDGQWQPAENIGNTVNTLYFESSSALSANGQQLYIYRDENNGDLFVSDRKSDNTWSTPQPLSSNINSSYSENSVSISPDGQTLYFSSNRPGGYGGIDIYKCEKDRRGVWGRVTNLGDAINTPFDEDGVFIDHDGKTLYFSSRGHKGIGGYDIYKSTYDEENNQWSAPVNLGYPINTPDDDIYFVSTKDGKRGYYATVRNGGLGYLDIYMVEIPDMTANVSSKLDKQNAKDLTTEKQQTTKTIEKVAVKPTTPPVTQEEAPPVAAKETPAAPMVTTTPVTDESLQPVRLLLKVEDRQTAAALGSKVKLKSSTGNREHLPTQVAEGIYQFEIQQDKAQQYMLSVESPGYMFKSMKMEIPAAKADVQEFRKKIGLDRVAEGYRMVLDFIYFDFNSANLKKESRDGLQSIQTFLESNQNTTIEIAGHTDNWGPRAYNKDLSQKRAQAIVDYLVKQGIEAPRLIARGYGEAQPLASNDDEAEGRELNRRVELRVISNREPQLSNKVQEEF